MVLNFGFCLGFLNLKKNNSYTYRRLVFKGMVSIPIIGGKVFLMPPMFRISKHQALPWSWPKACLQPMRSIDLTQPVIPVDAWSLGIHGCIVKVFVAFSMGLLSGGIQAISMHSLFDLKSGGIY